MNSYKLGFSNDKFSHLWKSLVGVWSPNLGIVSTDLRDSSGRNNYGTGVGSPTWSVDRFGPVVVFDGASQYVNVGTMRDFGSRVNRGISIELWLKSSITNAVMVPCGMMKTSSGLTSVILRINSSITSSLLAGGVRFAITDLDGPTVLSGGANFNTGITNGRIHQLVVTIKPDINTIAIYVDGVSQAITYQLQNTPNNFENWTQPFFIGANNGFGTPTQYFNGQIGHISMWNRVLRNNEVQQLYAQPLSVFNRSNIIEYQNTSNFFHMF